MDLYSVVIGLPNLHNRRFLVNAEQLGVLQKQAEWLDVIVSPISIEEMPIGDLTLLMGDSVRDAALLKLTDAEKRALNVVIY